MGRVPVGLVSSIRESLGRAQPCNCNKKKPATTTCPVCSFPDPISEPEQNYIHPSWASHPSVVACYIEALREVMAQEICPPKTLSGEGVLFCGEGKYWIGIVIAVKLLREIGCNLPVQVWFNGEIGHELDTEPNVKLIDCREVVKSHPVRLKNNQLRGWEQTYWAVLHSGFKKCCFLDADAMLISSPEPLFKLLDQYSFAYWKDFENCRGHINWSFFGIDGNYVNPVQGGQLFINVETFWRELMIANWLNMHSCYTFSHGYGNQDQLRIALAACKNHDRYLSLGDAIWRHPSFLCSYEKVDYVVHACQGKLWPSWHPEWRNVNPNYSLPMQKRVFELYNEIHNQYAERIFKDIYKRGVWWGENHSGYGSTLEQAQPYIDTINKFITDNQVSSIVELGVGDGRIISKIVCDRITSIDIVDLGFNDITMDIFKDRDKLPSGDLLLCKDMLQHWPCEMIITFLKYLRDCGKYKTILITNCNRQEREFITLGDYRGLNPALYPLNKFNWSKIADYGSQSILQLL